MGSTQDPRFTLIGNVYLRNQKELTSESLFVKNSDTKRCDTSDELSRAHPDAWNILMTYLTKVRDISDLMKTDKPLSMFLKVLHLKATNIGNEYISTRVMDKALMDRFTIVNGCS